MNHTMVTDVGGPANSWLGREATRVDSRSDQTVERLPKQVCDVKVRFAGLKLASQLTDDGADSCRFATRPPVGRATLRNRGIRHSSLQAAEAAQPRSRPVRRENCVSTN